MTGMHKALKKFSLFCCFLAAAFPLSAKIDSVSVSVGDTAVPKRALERLMPKFTATVMGRYEFSPSSGSGHFELRHSRVGLSGNIHPMFSYMVLVDLSYGGKFSPVAIFARFEPVKGLSFLIGYDKLPFSSENLLSPYRTYFSDKSFLTQKITAWSDVGGVIGYKRDGTVPFEVKAGLFNSSGFSSQRQLQKQVNGVFRGTLSPFHDFTLSFDYASIQPEALRMRHIGVDLAYTVAGLHLETEYLYKRYSCAPFSSTHAFYGLAFYEIPLRKKMLHGIQIGGRYDAITPNCTGKLSEKGVYEWEQFRQRITAGVTLMFIEQPVRASVRVNYEKNFFRAGVENNEDRIILEMIAHY